MFQQRWHWVDQIPDSDNRNAPAAFAEARVKVCAAAWAARLTMGKATCPLGSAVTCLSQQVTGCLS